MNWIISRVVSILVWAWRSYVAVTLWAWFAEPIGGAHVTVVRAMGIGLIVSLAVHRVSHAEVEAEQRFKDTAGEALYKSLKPLLGFEDDETQEARRKERLGKFWLRASQIIIGVVAPLLALGFGWLYRQFL